jgi:hypothetical protein
MYDVGFETCNLECVDTRFREERKTLVIVFIAVKFVTLEIFFVVDKVVCYRTFFEFKHTAVFFALCKIDFFTSKEFEFFANVKRDDLI